MARSASASKPAYDNLTTQGVKVVAIDLDGSEAELAKALQGQDVVIASVPPNALESQLPLIRAAKLANVKRFVPSAFAMAIAPSGVSTVQKEVGFRPDRHGEPCLVSPTRCHNRLHGSRKRKSTRSLRNLGFPTRSSTSVGGTMASSPRCPRGRRTMPLLSLISSRIWFPGTER